MYVCIHIKMMRVNKQSKITIRLSCFVLEAINKVNTWTLTCSTFITCGTNGGNPCELLPGEFGEEKTLLPVFKLGIPTGVPVFRPPGLIRTGPISIYIKDGNSLIFCK